MKLPEFEIELWEDGFQGLIEAIFELLQKRMMEFALRCFIPVLRFSPILLPTKPVHIVNLILAIRPKVGGGLAKKPGLE